LVEANRQAAVRYLDERAAQRASPDLRVEGRVVVAASVPRAIQEMAWQGGSSLLVLSAHGRAAGSGWSYGGVAWSLLSHGVGPVLVFQDLPRRRPPRARDTGRYARAAARTGATWSE
jgi:nucleotide-binding universal stress UspA family protein